MFGTNMVNMLELCGTIAEFPGFCGISSESPMSLPD